MAHIIPALHFLYLGKIKTIVSTFWIGTVTVWYIWSEIKFSGNVPNSEKVKDEIKAKLLIMVMIKGKGAKYY